MATQAPVLTVNYDCPGGMGGHFAPNLFAQDSVPGGTIASTDWASRMPGLHVPIRWRIEGMAVNQPASTSTTYYTQGEGYGYAVYLYNGTGSAMVTATLYSYISKATVANVFNTSLATPGDIRKVYTVGPTLITLHNSTGVWNKTQICAPITTLPNAKWGWFITAGLVGGVTVASGQYGDGTDMFGVKMLDNTGATVTIETSGAVPDGKSGAVFGLALVRDNTADYTRIPVILGMGGQPAVAQWVGVT